MFFIDVVSPEIGITCEGKLTVVSTPQSCLYIANAGALKMERARPGTGRPRRRLEWAVPLRKLP
jgi:hypothetical protein